MSESNAYYLNECGQRISAINDRLATARARITDPVTLALIDAALGFAHTGGIAMAWVSYRRR